MAERIKLSRRGFELGHGGYFSLGSHGVRGERPPSPTWEWQIHTGAHLKILPKTNTYVFKTYSTLPHSSTG